MGKLRASGGEAAFKPAVFYFTMFIKMKIGFIF
jgi:hypothetical protein